MELKITEKKDEPLLSRTKLEADVVFEGATPSKKEVIGKLSAVLGKDEKLFVAKKIHNFYGLSKAKAVSYVYDNENDLRMLMAEGKKAKEKAEKGEK